MPPEPNIGELYQFVLEKFSDEPGAKRARLCRELAEIIGSANFARDLIRQATELEAIEARHDQLLLDFRRKHGGRGDALAQSS